MPSLVQIGPVILEKKLKMWKGYDDNDDDNNGNDNDNNVEDRERTNFDEKSSLEHNTITIGLST